MSGDLQNFQGYDFKYLEGTSVTHYKKYFLEIYPIIFILTTAYVIYKPLTTPPNAKINYNVFPFIIVTFFTLILIIMLGYFNKDIIFEIDIDRNLPDDEYREIFEKFGYHMFGKHPNKLEFTKYIWYLNTRFNGFIEFLEDRIKIQVNENYAYHIEEEIVRPKLRPHPKEIIQNEIDFKTFMNYNGRYENGIFIRYYKKYLIRSLLGFPIMAFIIFLLIGGKDASQLSLSFNLFLLVIVFLLAVMMGILLPEMGKDVIFEMERDPKISMDDYIKIFRKYSYKLISKSPNKILFNYFSWIVLINYHGYIEFKNKTIKIKVVDEKVSFIETSIIKLQHKNNFITSELRDFLTHDYQYKDGTEISYYFKYLLRFSPFLLLFILVSIYRYLTFVDPEFRSSVLDGIIMISLGIPIFIYMFLEENYFDVVFELDRDPNIKQEDYIRIFQEVGYNLISNSSYRIKFNRFVWFTLITYFGQIEFLDNKIKIRIEKNRAHKVEFEIAKLQYENKIKK